MASTRAVSGTVTLGTVRGRSSFLELTRRLAALAGCLAGLSRSRIRAVRLGPRRAGLMAPVRAVDAAMTVSAGPILIGLVSAGMSRITNRIRGTQGLSFWNGAAPRGVFLSSRPVLPLRRRQTVWRDKVVRAQTSVKRMK